jgi:HD superfamily phosphodiesterase
MDYNPLKVFLNQRLRNFDSGHDLKHCIDVMNMAKDIFSDFPDLEDYQRTSIELACLLHEVNDSKFIQKNRQIKISNILFTLYPYIDDRIPQLVEEIVEAVSCSSNGDSEMFPPWKAIVRYVDRYFAIGKIGIERAIIYAESKNRPMASVETPRSYTRKDVEDNTKIELWEKYISGKSTSNTTIDHFYEKVLHITLPKWFNSPTLQKYYENSHNEVADFIVTYFQMERNYLESKPILFN